MSALGERDMLPLAVASAVSGHICIAISFQLGGKS